METDLMWTVIYISGAAIIFTLFMWWIWVKSPQEKELQRQIDMMLDQIGQNNSVGINMFGRFKTHNGKDEVLCLRCWKPTSFMTSVVTKDGHLCPECSKALRYV